MKTLIKQLVESIAPSGYEKAVRDLVHNQIKPHVDEIQIDALGNLIARKGKKGNGGLRVMLAAHMDEIGLITTHIDENGFVRFAPIGGVSPLTCLGGRVLFLDGTPGVIGIEKTSRQAGTLPTFEHLFIDVGASSKEACPVRIGSLAVFDRYFQELGENLVAKAMDDRIGVAVLIQTICELKKSPHELYFVFSAQEEVGTRGAGPAAYGTDPELGLSIDVTRTGDTPKAIKMAVSLGKGPAIKIRDSGMLSDPRLVQCLINRAESANIPYQLEVLEEGSTDARAIQISRAGVPSGCVSIPCRYIHSPSEMVNYNDVVNTVKLLVEFLSQAIEL
ncbi:MAG: M42 family metallopeptidase [Anaerolineae bacterium]|nr:M42 family metallopeptidase [Anaerolineae bacterium]